MSVFIQLKKEEYLKRKFSLSKYKVYALQLTLVLITIFVLYITFITHMQGESLVKKVSSVNVRLTSINYERKQKQIRNKISSKIDFKLMTDFFMDSKRAELEERRNTMAKYCKKFNETDKNLDDILSNIIIDKKHNISWCPIYKAASSTWMKNFAVLGGILSKPIIKLLKENKVALNVLVKQTFSHVLVNNATVTLSELEDTRKILIVRHPLERLLSAYRDKLENMINREYYYKRFGRYIAYKYHESRKENETSLEPTFKEFLQYIVDEKYFDEHWAPYYSTCIPCTINYDFILKLETLDEDEKFLIQETGLVYELDLHEVSKVKNSNPNGITNEEVVVKYLKNIPASLLQKLDKIYDKDFKLFNYESSQQYLMKNQT